MDEPTLKKKKKKGPEVRRRKGRNKVRLDKKGERKRKLALNTLKIARFVVSINSGREGEGMLPSLVGSPVKRKKKKGGTTLENRLDFRRKKVS